MPSPIFVFAFVFATLLGALTHLILGGGAQRLAVFLLAGWIGFGAGQLAGYSLDVMISPIGDLRVIPALVGALFTLGAAWAFTSPRR